MSSISECELAKDRVNGDGKAPENVVISSQDTVVRRSRGEVTSTDSISLEKSEMALAGFDVFGVDIPPVRWLWEHPCPGSSRLVIAGTDGLEPSSMSKCRMSIVYHNGNSRVGT